MEDETKVLRGDLIRELREAAEIPPSRQWRFDDEDLATRAADRIEALERELHQCREKNTELVGDIETRKYLMGLAEQQHRIDVERAEQAEAEVERLKGEAEEDGQEIEHYVHLLEYVEAQAARLREALERIAQTTSG